MVGLGRSVDDDDTALIMHIKAKCSCDMCVHIDLQCSELQKQVEKLKRENKELQMKHIATQSLSPGQSIRPGSWIEQKLQARLNQALKVT